MSENFDRGLYKAIDGGDDCDLEPWPQAVKDHLVGLVVVIGTMAVSIGFFAAIALVASIIQPLM